MLGNIGEKFTIKRKNQFVDFFPFGHLQRRLIKLPTQICDPNG